ncbi:MAG TPA: hypothetical protein VH988_30255 [Thermoanaerobaculia bacterium]|jgi:hypothetical protein|nr:hypothetical protein [Thermoanaerobaculia bacterium]
MKPILLVLMVIAASASDLAHEVALTREMIEDAAIRYDDEGLRLGRERAARLAAEGEAAGDTRLARDAHTLIALSAWAQVYTGHNPLAALRRIAEEGSRHADRAAALDERFPDALVLAAALRGSTFMLGVGSPEKRTAMIDLLKRALAADSAATPVGVLNGLARSIDPAGPARPEGIEVYAGLVRRLDARRGADNARPGFWDLQARAWYAVVRLQNLAPDIAPIRADVARLTAMRPDSELARELAARVEHRSWAPAAAVSALAWQPLGSDAAGDGAQAAAPDLRALAFARDPQRVWFRLAFERDLPPSFGLNVVIDRDGDPGDDAAWWGKGSHFRFDRLVTAWVVREGDGYFGRVGVTDAMGAVAGRLEKLTTDVALRLGEDGKSVMVGVSVSVLDLTPQARVIAAAGTNLTWNDDLTAPAGEGIALPAQ